MNNTTSDEFSKSILISFLIHGCIILMFTIKAILLPNETFEFEPSMRVDLVALPDKIPSAISDSATPPEPPKPEEKVKPVKEELPPPPTTQNKKVEEVKTPDGPTVNLKKEDKDKKPKAESAINKIRESMALDKIKQMLKDSKDTSKTQTAAQQATYKGNVLSPGTELTGLNKLQHESYSSELDRHVKKYWSLPEWLAHKPYSAQVRIYLNEQGALINAKIVKSSGVKEYDDSVLESARKASPYPPPPPKFKDIVAVTGILFGFPE